MGLFHGQLAGLAHRVKSYRKHNGRLSDEINNLWHLCFVAFVYTHRLHRRFENRQARLAFLQSTWFPFPFTFRIVSIAHYHLHNPFTYNQRAVRDTARQNCISVAI
jgi:hypothetical protein